jgi:hypothetical protein
MRLAQQSFRGGMRSASDAAEFGNETEDVGQ